MDLALARIRDNIGQLRGPVQRSAQVALRQRIGGRVKVQHLRYYFGAALLAALVGIAVNALLFQHERHPAPLFGYAAPKLPSAIPTSRFCSRGRRRPGHGSKTRRHGRQRRVPARFRGSSANSAGRGRRELGLGAGSDRRTAGRGRSWRRPAFNPDGSNRPGQAWLSS